MGKSNKKVKALDSVEFNGYLMALENMGIRANDIQELYDIVKDAKISVAKDTFVIRIVEAYQYFLDIRNKGIGEKDSSYIGKTAFMNMVRANPKLLDQDSHNIDETCKTIDAFKWAGAKKTNQVIMSSPIVFNIGRKKLEQQDIILSNFNIWVTRDEKMSLSEYVFTQAVNNLKTSPQKLFARLSYFANENERTNLTKRQFEQLMKTTKDFERRFNITDEVLNKRYVLPEYNPDDKEVYSKQVEEIINGFRIK